MWSRLYRNHVIMPFPSYDTATSAWAPQADISWCVGPSRESEFVRFPNRFLTEAEAVACALRKSEAWVDARLLRRELRASGSEQARLIGMGAAPKNSLTKANSAQPPLPLESTPRHAENAFTFGQFKSAIGKSGLKLSEPTLQKSYAALIKLRKTNHWSWAATRQKVDHAQKNRSVAQSTARRQRAVRIPLTERDWRRIG